MAESLHHRCVVGEGLLVGLSVGSLQQLDVEGLRCLHQPVVVAEDVALLHVAQRLHHGHHGYDGLLAAGLAEATGDDVCGDEGSHAVVHAHHALCIVGDECQAVLHGVEAGAAAVGQLVADVELVLAAQLMPVALLFARQHQDDVQLFRVLAEAHQRAHQHRNAAHGQKLFGHIAAHAQALAARHNDDVVSHKLRFYLSCSEGE